MLHSMGGLKSLANVGPDKSPDPLAARFAAPCDQNFVYVRMKFHFSLRTGSNLTTFGRLKITIEIIKVTDITEQPNDKIF